MATIELLRSVRPELRWTPEVGPHTLAFLGKKSKDITDSRVLETVLFEAQTILGRCVPPAQSLGNDTGLVVGYVQSGKTLSFTTVMALARDNGYQLVILIAGIGVILKSQSETRLLADLGIDSPERAWAHFENPTIANDDAVNISNILGKWKRQSVPPNKRRTVLITVLKQHVRLRGLVNVLRNIDLAGVPTLIVDDEADQASLNSQTARNRSTGSKRKSTTYDWITQLKSVVPHHTFIQYTATPQAPLLLSLTDVLSPSFAELVTPGPGYVGGRDFLASNSNLILTIPLSDLPSLNNPLTRPPSSLLSALRYFLLGAAIHYLSDDTGNRSMMIHPSQSTAPHADYKRWIEQTVKAWADMLSQSPNNPAYVACVALFDLEYKSIRDMAPGVPSLDAIVRSLPEVIADTRIMQVNSTAQGERNVKWNDNAYWILVGGQKLDRGFTVEGLTVTYMPRSIGTGNADTLQQRARFFGYKAKYRELCRVFLEQGTRDALTEYVESEEFVRDSLRNFQGRPLADWKRDFVLTRMLNPTRRGVIGLDIDRVTLQEGWLTPGYLHTNDSAVIDNRALFTRLVERWKTEHKWGDAASVDAFKDSRTDSPRNWIVYDLRIEDVLNEFLVQVRAPDFEDSSRIRGLCLALVQYLKRQPDALCDAILIGEMIPQTRSAKSADRINQVFVGKSPNIDDFDKLNYVGDSALRWRDKMMLHLRTFNLRNDKQSRIHALDIPWFTLYVPAGIAKDSVVESRT